MRAYTFCSGLFIAILCGALCSAPAMAQTNDPLQKPKVWERLQTAPLDSAIWASYLGKPWICMTASEKEVIRGWRDFLKSNIATPQTTAKSNKPSDNDAAFWEIDKLKREVASSKKGLELEASQKAYVNQLEEMLVQEPSNLKSLKENIGANFIIIEDVLQEEFAQLGVEYTFYDSVHPDGKYSQEKWVQEKGAQLIQLKKLQVERMKTKMFGSNE